MRASLLRDLRGEYADLLDADPLSLSASANEEILSETETTESTGPPTSGILITRERSFASTKYQVSLRGSYVAPVNDPYASAYSRTASRGQAAWV